MLDPWVKVKVKGQVDLWGHKVGHRDLLINYCIVVWSNTSKTNLLRIHKLQKYAARIILDAAPDAPSKPLFDELNWLNIFEKINYQKSILLYKIKHEPSPSYLHQLFPTTYSTSRVLRSNTQDNLNIPRPNTEKFKHRFQYSGARLWNDLPANIRNSNSLYSFKNSMLKHIKSKSMERQINRNSNI